MANRTFYKGAKMLERDPVILFLRATIGASGAVTLNEGKGVTSITKESTAGQYTIVLQDKYAALLAMSAHLEIPTTGLAAGPDIAMLGSLTTGNTLKIQCSAPTGASNVQAATNPASGEILKVMLVLRDSPV
jgi:hypothetical protein